MFRSWGLILLPVLFGGHHRRFLPYAVDGAFKQTLLSLFRLAWSSKVQLPLLITVAFMAFDVRLQIEINIFWEQRHAQQQQQQRRIQQVALPAGGAEPADADGRDLEDEPRAPLAQEEDDDDIDDDDDDEGDNVEDDDETPLVVQVEFRQS